MKYLNITIFLLFSQFLLPAQYLTPEWSRFQLTHASDSGPGGLPIILVDSLRNVVVCGVTYHPGPVLGFITTKYDSNGVFLWEQRYDQWNQDQITAAELSATGDIYVGGNSFNPTTYLAEGKLFKYDPDGNVLWAFNYNPDNSGYKTTLSDIVVLPNQNILVVGTLISPGATQSGSYIVCIQPDGALLWSRELTDGTAFTIGKTSSGFALWGTKTIADDSFLVCWTIDNNGTLLSTAMTERYNDYFEYRYHVDKSGNLYIGDFFGEYKISKYTTNGNLDWFYTKPYIAHPNPFYVTARSGSIATDDEGNVFFCGIYYADSITGQITITTCLDSFGENKWEHILTFNGDNNVSGSATGKYTNGNYINTGWYSTNPSENKRTFYIAYYGLNGYINGGISTMTGEKNSVFNLLVEKEHTYVSGSNHDSLFYEKQFVSKHKTPILSTTTQPEPVVRPLTIYPNPATQVVWINCNYEGKTAPAQIEITDHSGRVVMTYWLETTPTSTQQIAIKGIARLPLGTYSIVLRAGTAVYAGKFIKI